MGLKFYSANNLNKLDKGQQEIIDKWHDIPYETSRSDFKVDWNKRLILQNRLYKSDGLSLIDIDKISSIMRSDKDKWTINIITYSGKIYKLKYCKFIMSPADEEVNDLLEQELIEKLRPNKKKQV